MKSLLLSTLPATGTAANWIWGVIGFVIAALAIMIIIALVTVKDTKNLK